MEIIQFYDEALAHASYAILSEGQVALVDPARDTAPYLTFAEERGASIKAVFETHPHADFVSSHNEWIEKYQVKVYIHPKVNPAYSFIPLAHGEEVFLGKVKLRALFTPGHSPDHNTYLLIDENGNKHAAFTGDALFVGDVGRPDLREGAGNEKLSRKELAAMMYDTVNSVFKKLSDEVLVYPAHGPGSLCGKNMSPDRSSTIGHEKKNNWAFQIDDKKDFIDSFLDGQPFIPYYFPYDVELNRKGATALSESIDAIVKLQKGSVMPSEAIIVDVRSENSFKEGHQSSAFNIQLGGESSKFETWLGATLKPNEKFYLQAADEAQLIKAIERVAKIGYETNIVAATHHLADDLIKEEEVDVEALKDNPDQFNIIDVRNANEFANGAFFKNAVNIPLPELRQRLSEVETDKPILVHCAGGYRSAVGSSIIATTTNQKVYDLSDAVSDFK